MDTPVTISDRNKPACQTKHLTIGALTFPRMDQIDFTGPFEVLSRIPNLRELCKVHSVHLISMEYKENVTIHGTITHNFAA